MPGAASGLPPEVEVGQYQQSAKLGQIDLEIVVNQNISHASYLPPRNLRTGRSELRAEILGGFTDHLEIANHAILNQTRGHKAALTSSSVIRDALQTITNTVEIEAILAHSN